MSRQILYLVTIYFFCAVSGGGECFVIAQEFPEFSNRIRPTEPAARALGNFRDLIIVGEDSKIRRIDSASPGSPPVAFGGVDAPIADLVPGLESKQPFVVLENGKIQKLIAGQPPTTLANLAITGKLRAFAGGEGHAAVVSETGSLVVVDLKTGTTTAPLELGAGSQSVAVSGDLRLAAVAKSDRLELFDIQDRSVFSTLPVADAQLVAVDAGRRLAAVATDLRGIEIWDVGTSQRMDVQLAFQNDNIWYMKFLDQGDLLVVSKSGVATLFDAHTWSPVRTVIVPAEEKSKSVSTDESGSLLIVLNDGTLVQEEMVLHGAQKMVATKPAEVTVWYATNRMRLDTAASFGRRWWMTVARLDYLIAMAACVLVCFVMVVIRPTRPYAAVPLLGIPAFALLAVLSVAYQSSKGPAGPGSALSNDLAEQISWGRCVVLVPSNRDALGDVPAPADPFGFGGDSDPEKHFVLVSESRRTADQVASEIKSLVTPDPPEEILLFVHGFNVPFEAVAKRTAQLKLDLRIDGPAFFFSWPSYGREALYTWDEDNAEASDMAFEAMLRELSKRYPDSRMHVLAHSMGTRIVMEALCRIHRQTEDHPRVDSLVLAAPDIDRRQFKIEMAEIVKKTNFPVTLYASSKDWALRLSYVANKNDRLGHTQPEIVISEGMESIDASRIDTDFLGHGYYGDERELLGDLHQLFKDKRLADKRFGLRVFGDGEKKSWVLLP